MSEKYENLAYQWFEEVWNKRREEAIEELFHEDGIAHGLSDDAGKPLVGPEGFKTLHRAFLSAFPDIHITVEDTVCEGDKIAARCTIRATHQGEGIGVSPTKNEIEFSGMGMVTVRDGKIAEAWNYFDFMKMYQQVGALELKLK